MRRQTRNQIGHSSTVALRGTYHITPPFQTSTFNVSTIIRRVRISEYPFSQKRNDPPVMRVMHHASCIMAEHVQRPRRRSGAQTGFLNSDACDGDTLANLQAVSPWRIRCLSAVRVSACVRQASRFPVRRLSARDKNSISRVAQPRSTKAQGHICQLAKEDYSILGSERKVCFGHAEVARMFTFTFGQRC